MSRYNLPSTYKILLFLLATIAFPPMVTAIPNFLLLKQLGMLNTFFALILPGMVNGYAIFLLKGFFDSLPRELYEAAQIDGAGEWTMFWLITMNLSKPILAVIALDAFNAAYGAFMFAFIVCQNEKMWTLGVYLYNLQQYAHQSVTFAALLVASIPTFLVFVLAQRIILQGIVVPIEK
jgi:multiple sugar transport system permease protein